MKRVIVMGVVGVALLAAAVQLSGCARSGAVGSGSAAEKVYVKPG